jgi:hypothetical protein
MPKAKTMTFSSRSNAKRAAEKAIAAGTAPSIDYGIGTHPSGRFEIAWHVKEATMMRVLDEQGEDPMPSDEEAAEAEVRPLTLAEAQANTGWPDTDPGTDEAEPEPIAVEPSAEIADADPDLWLRPSGTRVQVAVSKKRVRLGTGAPGGVSNLYRVDQLSATDAPVPEPTPKKKRQGPAQPSNRQPSRSAQIDAAAAAGIMPAKPIMTSKANPHYQARFDKLEALAEAGDWDAVRAYQVKGINSYAKMVAAYRDRLLAAHGAKSETP